MNKSSLSLLLMLGLAIGLSGCFGDAWNAVHDNNPERLQEVLNRPNHDGANFHSLLLMSARSGCDKCVQPLFNAGAKPVNLGRALGESATHGHSKVVRALLDNGVDPEEGIAWIHSKDYYKPAQVQAAVELIRRTAQERVSKPAVDASGSADKESASSTPAQPAASGSAVPWWGKTDGK